MNKQDLNNWKNRILNEVGPESYKLIKQTLEDKEDIDYDMKVKRIKMFEDYFDQIQALRWETNLEVADSQRKEYKEFFKSIEQTAVSNKPSSFGVIKKLLPPFVGGVAAATLGLIGIFDVDFNKNKPENDLNQDRFKEDLVLENLINDGQTLGESDKITMISPEIQGDFSKKILFKWTYTGKKELELELLDNQNVSLSKGARVILPKNISEIEFNTISFEPGLYYWKITQNGELLVVGKFIIE